MAVTGNNNEPLGGADVLGAISDGNKVNFWLLLLLIGLDTITCDLFNLLWKYCSWVCVMSTKNKKKIQITISDYKINVLAKKIENEAI